MPTKKNYVSLSETWEVRIESKNSDSSIMKIKGRNKKGTEMEVTIVIEDYNFPYMIKDMALIGRRRVQSANDRMKSILNAVNE